MHDHVVLAEARPGLSRMGQAPQRPQADRDLRHTPEALAVYNRWVFGRLAVLGIALFLPACVGSPTDPGPVTGALTLTINPVVVTVSCPSSELCLAYLDATVTLAETAGLGGRIQGFDLVIRNKDTGRDETTVPLGTDWVRTQVGTDRLEARGSLAFRTLVNGFPIATAASRATRQVFITAKVLDDKGNQLTQTAGLELVPTSP